MHSTRPFVLLQVALCSLWILGSANAQTLVSSAVGQPVTGISTSAGGATVYSGVYGQMATPDLDGTPMGGAVSTGYRYQITATGGTTPYTFSTPDPSKLPPGLSLDANGLITGTPTATGSYTFEVTVTDAAGLPDTASFTIVITAQQPMSAPKPVPASTPLGLVLLSTLFGLWAWRRRFR